MKLRPCPLQVKSGSNRLPPGSRMGGGGGRLPCVLSHKNCPRVPGGSRQGLDGAPVGIRQGYGDNFTGVIQFFTPRRPRVTFNYNLKVTRAPARNKPRIKPVNCPAGARRGPCWDPPGTRGHILKESPLAPPPCGTRGGGSLWGPDSACIGTRAESRRCPYDARTVPGRDPWINLQEDTQLLSYNVQSINP